MKLALQIKSFPKTEFKSCQKEKLSKSNPEITYMDRENVYHWGALRENNGKNTEEEQKPGDKNARRAKKHAMTTRDYAKTIRCPFQTDDISTFPSKLTQPRTNSRGRRRTATKS